MEYEDIIEDDGEDAAPQPEEDLEAATETPEKKSPWKAFILTGFIASLIGAAGGGYGVYQGVKTFSPVADAQPDVDISPLETKLKVLSERMSKAEADVKTAANRPAPEIDLPEPVDLSGLESRLEALESAPTPDIDPAALTALKSAQADGFEWPDTSALEDRLSVLETQLEADSIETDSEPSAEMTDLLARLDALEKLDDANVTLSAGDAPLIITDEITSLDSSRLDDIETRLSALENRPALEPRIERVSVLALPKAAMIAAVEDNVEGGVLKKAFSKHVRVKGDDDPLTLIDDIEADIAKGRLEEAATKFNRLPDPVRAAGQAWYDSVKASL
jgi:hypothetical protein